MSYVSDKLIWDMLLHCLCNFTLKLSCCLYMQTSHTILWSCSILLPMHELYIASNVGSTVAQSLNSLRSTQNRTLHYKMYSVLSTDKQNEHALQRYNVSWCDKMIIWGVILKASLKMCGCKSIVQIKVWTLQITGPHTENSGWWCLSSFVSLLVTLMFVNQTLLHLGVCQVLTLDVILPLMMWTIQSRQLLMKRWISCHTVSRHWPKLGLWKQTVYILVDILTYYVSGGTLNSTHCVRNMRVKCKCSVCLFNCWKCFYCQESFYLDQHLIFSHSAVFQFWFCLIQFFFNFLFNFT